MRTVAILFLLVTASVQAQTDLLEQTLGRFGLDSASVGYRPQRSWNAATRDDPFRLPWFDAMLERPLKIPNFTREMLWRYRIWATADSANFPRPMLAKIRPVSALVMNSARNLGYDVGKYG